ncbi:hypothetical protein F4604DRAFT_455465 [Suillus subluteus]|nr:hypothetical protein F4604DRAFT_455465 [Suillus subluteus]
MLSVEIRAPFELDRMLGNAEVVGKYHGMRRSIMETSLSIPPFVYGLRPSLTLMATVLHICDNQDNALLDWSIVGCRITRYTDAGHVQFATYVTSKTIAHLNDVVQHFQLVLDQCPVWHLHRAAALTHLAWARLEGYIRKDFQDIDSITSLFREALALRPQGHPDHP